MRMQLNESYSPKYFVCVTANNNNKFYRCIPDPDQQGFTVEYGRIGAPTFQTHHYPIEDWYKKIESKLKKGYVDQTDLVATAISSTTGEDGFAAIKDKSVNDLIKALRRYANETIKQNYTIAANAVTQEMLDTAKKYIDDLNEIVDELSKGNSSSRYFNDVLMKLFRAVPRKMNKVDNFLLHISDAREAAKIVDREQKLYDVLLTNFQTQQATKDSKPANDTSSSVSPTETILEKFGLECQLVEDQATIDQIKNHMGQVASKFKRAFIVVNKKTQDAYAAFMSKFPNCTTKLFFHGSKNENFWSILKNGLGLNPKASVTGKLLGNGIYFANKAAKSINYTSLKGSYWSNGTSNIGFMAVFAVACDPNKSYDVWTHSDMSKCNGLTWDKLQKLMPGATHVYGHKATSSHPGSWLREDEFCIYREDQCTIRYLVELTV